MPNVQGVIISHISWKYRQVKMNVEMLSSQTHKNPVYDFAHHKSPIAQLLERSNRYSGRSWVQLPLGNSENLLAEYLT